MKLLKRQDLSKEREKKLPPPYYGEHLMTGEVSFYLTQYKAILRSLPSVEL